MEQLEKTTAKAIDPSEPEVSVRSSPITGITDRILGLVALPESIMRRDAVDASSNAVDADHAAQLDMEL